MKLQHANCQVALALVTTDYVRMRPLVPYTLAALASFSVGFAGVRLLPESHAPAPQKKTASRADAAAPPVQDVQSKEAGKARLAAVLALGGKDRDLAEDHALFLAISELQAGDFLTGADGMLALLKRFESPSGSPNVALAEAWMERWLEVDAAGALRFFESAPFLAELSAGPDYLAVGDRCGMPLGSIFKVLARRQPEWAQRYLASLKPGSLREVGSYVLLREVAEQDSAKAKLLFAALGEGANRPAVLRGYIAGLAQADVAREFRAGLR